MHNQRSNSSQALCFFIRSVCFLFSRPHASLGVASCCAASACLPLRARPAGEWCASDADHRPADVHAVRRAGSTQPQRSQPTTRRREPHSQQRRKDRQKTTSMMVRPCEGRPVREVLDPRLVSGSGDSTRLEPAQSVHVAAVAPPTAGSLESCHATSTCDGNGDSDTRLHPHECSSVTVIIGSQRQSQSRSDTRKHELQQACRAARATWHHTTRREPASCHTLVGVTLISTTSSVPIAQRQTTG